jgi:cation diffusion facilitator CzcD-associated flavoprotein CzcO
VIVDVAIVGAGFAGIGMGAQLRRAGRESFVILERATDVGGTWRDNVYPGVASDVPAHLYSYSFRRQPDWSRLFAPGAEILSYLRDAVREEGLAPHLRLGTEVLDIRWNGQRWDVATSTGFVSAGSVVLAAGRLAEPRMAEVDGTFDGLAFHSSRWPDDLDLTGLRVGVIGTGSSAAQLIPYVAEASASVVVFQRSAPWVIPRNDRPAVDDDYDELFAVAEEGFAARALEPDAIGDLRARALGHLGAQVADPVLRQALTPEYEIGCKRVVISDDLYPALSLGHVTVESSAVARVDGSLVESSAGRSFELDVLIHATGFKATRPPYAAIVTGRDGETLAAHWADGMTAFASTAVHGFPNLFVINGPNATLGHNSAIHVIESQVGYILGALAHVEEIGQLDVSAEAEAEYVSSLDATSASTVWMTGCSSWYRDESSGRLTLIWPGTAAEFRRRNGTFDPAPYAVSAAYSPI